MHKLSSWRPRVDATRSEGELLQVVRDYLDAWLPSELSQLPEICQNCRPSSVEELTHYAVDFKRAEFTFAGSPEAQELLREMSQTFAHAAERLRIFHHPAVSRGGEG